MVDLPIPDVVIYTTQTCPYCTKAKVLLESKNIQFKEIDVSHNPTKRAELVVKAQGRKTVPQIFIKDKPIGGYDDLRLLEDQGELDKKLQDGMCIHLKNKK